MRKKFLIPFLSLLALCIIAIGFVYEGEHRYFGKGAFIAQNQQLDGVAYDWCISNLKLMKEPSLYNTRYLSYLYRDTKYRFLYLRSFDEPIVINLNIDSSNKFGTITFKKLKYNGGNFGDLEESEEIKLNESETKQVLAGINESDFWNLPSHNKDNQGLDGSEWIFEGVKKGNYHLIYRWSPDKGEIRDLGLLLIQLSKIKINEIY